MQLHLSLTQNKATFGEYKYIYIFDLYVHYDPNNICYLFKIIPSVTVPLVAKVCSNWIYILLESGS